MALNAALDAFWVELLAMSRVSKAKAIRTAHYVARAHAPNFYAIAHFSQMLMLSYLESESWAD